MPRRKKDILFAEPPDFMTMTDVDVVKVKPEDTAMFKKQVKALMHMQFREGVEYHILPVRQLLSVILYMYYDPKELLAKELFRVHMNYGESILAYEIEYAKSKGASELDIIKLRHARRATMRRRTRTADDIQDDPNCALPQGTNKHRLLRDVLLGIALSPKPPIALRSLLAKVPYTRTLICSEHVNSPAETQAVMYLEDYAPTAANGWVLCNADEVYHMAITNLLMDETHKVAYNGPKGHKQDQVTYIDLCRVFLKYLVIHKLPTRAQVPYIMKALTDQHAIWTQQAAKPTTLADIEVRIV